MSLFTTPAGMSRRHFMQHLAGSAALVGPAFSFGSAIAANAQTLSRSHRSAILLWMGGGPPTIDMFDLKPGAATGGPFQPINTTGDMQICEHLPMLAEQMKHLALVRSMSTREADHDRGRYYLHTGYVPNPNIEHPSYGAVIAHEMIDHIPDLEIPPFISIGGPSKGPGFLGMAFAPFEVDGSGRIRNLEMGIDEARRMDRMKMLAVLERRFVGQNRGSAAEEHAKVLDKTLALMTSEQMSAFRWNEEDEAMQERYGASTGFGRGCLMARRLVESGVPFVEVSLGGWDLHQDNFDTLQTKLPQLDKSASALVEDLAQRGLLESTVIILMGEFGRTPRINGNAGRDHWARSWTALVGGGKFQGGRAIGETNTDGTRVLSEPYTSEDQMASVCHAMGISLETRFTAKNGRPMKIANNGKLINELFV